MKTTIVLVIIFLVAVVHTAPEEDRVSALKGYYDFTSEFSMYSGYLQLQEKPIISNHYVFITSKNNPQTDDLVLWLNGGPGCSSMLGFIQEFGPHVLHQGADKFDQSKNPFTWNRKANLLFIQSPPGVGFSINEDPNYVLYNDTQTALDNLNSLKQWFIKFPQFKNHRFWISGESYAGMYLPNLADQILKNQDSIVEGSRLDFQGMLIGNGIMDLGDYELIKMPIKFYESHYFFGPQILNLLNTCKYSPLDQNNPSCQIGLRLADDALARINAYNPIGICYNLQPFHSPHNKIHNRKYQYTRFYKGILSTENDQPDCNTDDSGMLKFFNDPTVQDQLHVRPTQWVPCSDQVGNAYTYGVPTVPLFNRAFKEAGLKILLYSGNVDAVVSYVATQEYIREIGWKVVKQKQPIKNPRGSLEGWVTSYENNLFYYVINAAGHMVPCQKPDAALKMFQNFIYNNL